MHTYEYSLINLLNLFIIKGTNYFVKALTIPESLRSFCVPHRNSFWRTEKLFREYIETSLLITHYKNERNKPSISADSFL